MWWTFVPLCRPQPSLKISLPTAHGDNGSGIGNFIEGAEFASLQDPIQIEQDDEASFQLAHSGDVVEFALLEYIVWLFDIRRRNSQNLRCGIHDQDRKTDVWAES